MHHELTYQSGFGNEHSSEALPGALPVGQNSPQQCPYGLYAEQLSGSAFTAPRHHNLRSWLYRVRPSVSHHGEWTRSLRAPLWKSAGLNRVPMETIGPRRWDPLPIPQISEKQVTFLDGITTYTTSGSVDHSSGMGAHLYVMNHAMHGTHGRQYLVNSDGELLILPQQGSLSVLTELGSFEVIPGEVLVIPRGILFQVNPLVAGPDDAHGKPCRGYICENYGAPFELPQLGPIGANCLANPRDFLSPVAHYLDQELEHSCEIFMKWGGQLYERKSPYSPMDVVAWHGNYAPYKYDLKRFCTLGSISFDHPDPSIFTVLTSPTTSPGVANVDFVIFPDRWLVAEHSFRPPWYHRNLMSEFMGLIEGQYDAKEEGFLPGGASLHNQMLAHGPDADGFIKASTRDLVPHKLAGTLAFMFETRSPQRVSDFAQQSPQRQSDYLSCWTNLPRRFDGTLDPT